MTGADSRQLDCIRVNVRNYFIGWSQEQLAASLRKVQAEIASGKRITSWGSGDTNVSKQGTTSPEEAHDRILYALHILDPATYPLSSIRRQTITLGRIENLR
jgi:hypothetical protein